MNKAQLSDAIGELKDEYVLESAPPVKKSVQWKKILAAAAAIAVCVFSSFAIRSVSREAQPPVSPYTTTAEEGTTAAANETAPQTSVAPEAGDPGAPNDAPRTDFLSFKKASANVPDYVYNSDSPPKEMQAIREALHFSEDDYKDLPYNFFGQLSEKLLKDPAQNAVVSPLSAFFALSLVTELSDGETRDQLLTILGVKDLESLRRITRSLWLCNYFNDPAIKPKDANWENRHRTLLFSNALWLNDKYDMTIDDEQKSVLQDVYFSYLFSGDPSDPEYTEAYRSWLNDTTGGLLEDAINKPSLTEDLIMQLESTVYCKLPWEQNFREDLTLDGTFHGEGGDTTVPFMHRDGEPGGLYFEEEGYAAYGISTAQTGIALWLLLPDGGSSVSDLLEADALTSLCERVRAKDKLRPVPDDPNTVYLYRVAVPKFDVSSAFDLKNALSSLGITKLFSSEEADFTPLTGTKNGLCVASCEQNVRLSIDEKGVCAAARTGMGWGFGDPEIVYIDFVCDRPFVFALLSSDGVPLFTGTITDLNGAE